jgi:integrase
MAVLNPDEARRLLEAASDSPLEALYVAAIGTGARFGELLGLRWEDIDLRRGAMSIQRTLVDVNGKLKTSEPKTSRGRRRIELPDFVTDALRRHRQQQAAEPHPKAWVFADGNGGPLRKSNVLRRSFRPLLKKARLPQIRFHDLRDTAATLLLAQGVHPKAVQERLGHATIAITLDTYSHVLPSMQRDAADQLHALVGGSCI